MSTQNTVIQVRMTARVLLEDKRKRSGILLFISVGLSPATEL